MPEGLQTPWDAGFAFVCRRFGFVPRIAPDTLPDRSRAALVPQFLS